MYGVYCMGMSGPNHSFRDTTSPVTPIMPSIISKTSFIYGVTLRAVPGYTSAGNIILDRLHYTGAGN